jgi:3-hydroxyisobutyrate dehydrogenase-like beta-hydroxyacid dehydrogenase
MTESVGIFGLGLMGTAVAERLLSSDMAVRGHDPDPARMAHLTSIGGTSASSEDVWEAELVVAAVFDTNQLADVIADAPHCAGACLISISTCDPERMPALAEEAKAKGIDLVEAPISGTSSNLAKGQVVFLVAGSPERAAKLGPFFEKLSRAHFHVGTIGNGNRTKLAINLVLGLNRAALAEGLVFARAIGLDPARFLDLAQQSSASSAVMAGRGAAMAERDFTPAGRIAQSAKDFSLILETANKAGQDLPFARTYDAMMQDCLSHSEGDLDNTAILLAIERWSRRG